MRKYIFLTLLVVLASGCTIPELNPGQDVIKAATSSQEEGFRDVLVIKEINTIPKSPILAGQPFLLSFVIENKDREKEAGGVVVDLFDAPLLKDKDGKEKCNTKPCLPNECNKEKSCTILPGEQKQINFELQAPKDAEISGLQTDTEINFLVRYKFNGTTTLKLVVVNLEEIKARQRAGSPITLDISKIFGSGPVKIDAELKGSQYMLSGYGGTIEFTTKVVGDTSKGGVQNSAVPKYENGLGLSIEFPKEIFDKPELEPKGDIGIPSVEIFNCDIGNTVICKNTGKELTVFKGESQPLLFRIVKTKPIDAPFRSFDVKAAIAYVYELRDSAKITILPVAKLR